MCEYCDMPTVKLIVDTERLTVNVAPGGLLYVEYHGDSEQEYTETPIDFCPMCCRKLKEGAR